MRFNGEVIGTYNKLRAKFVEAGLSQRQIADEIGICEHAMGRKLNGKTEFKLNEILEIAELLGIENPVTEEFLP